MANPIDHEALFDCVVLAGVASPGVVKLSGHTREIGWDVKKGPGQSGASTTRTSEDPVTFTTAFYLVKDVSQGIDEFEEFETFLDVAKSSVAGAEPKALDIYHPDLSRNDIKSVVLKSIGGAEHDGKGGQTIALQWLEYRPAKSKGGSPSGSKSKSADKKKTAPDPNAEALAELARLTEEYRVTPWG